MAKAGVSQLTYADLQALPDDHNRYELIDGELLVSASPNLAHQVASRRLTILLDAACPPGLTVLLAARDDDTLTERHLAHPPALAVEILSPSSRSVDLVRKRAAYERAGLDHYWVVDPLLPAVTVLARVAGRLVEVAAAKGDEPLAVERPFPVTVVAADLVA